ncbi:MAG TPA: ABC transporter substrate-binding protein [Papillibacter sp.]|nr:ABC transporter substrate-binding protein [Papillibacter sp.]
MKKLVSILLCVVFLLSFAACTQKQPPASSPTPGQTAQPTGSTPAGEDSPKPKKDTVSIGVDGDTGTLDPYMVSGNYLVVMRQYAEALWAYEAADNIKYFLAESVDFVSDTEWLIHLRKDVTFSNGSPFTADDVIFTFDYCVEIGRAFLLASVDFEKTRKEDDYTVRLFLTRPDTTLFPIMSDIVILDAETYNPETSGKNPVGTGPYVVKDYVVNSYVSLEARDDYWGGAPAIRNVVFKNIPESAQKVNAIETGEVDFLASCPPQDADYVDSLDGVHTYAKPSVSHMCLTYNACKDSPLATKEARWAVSYAVNSQGIINVALSGQGNVAVAPFSSASVDFFPELANLHDTYKTGYNLELAKKYAEESGLVGKTVRLVTNGSDMFVTTAQIVQQALKEIGVNAEVINYDQATVRNMIAGEEDWEIYVAYMAGSSGMGLDLVYAQISKFNRSHFDWDAEAFNRFKENGETLLATTDKAKYNELFLEYTKDFTDYCFVYGIAEMSTLRACRDDIGGVSLQGLQHDFIKEWYYID